MKTLVASAIAFATFWSAAASSAQAAPNAAELLRRMEGAEKNLRFSATAQVTRRNAPAMTMRIWQSGAKRRVEWLSPQIRRGDVLVDSGDSVWIYHRGENSAVQTRGNAEVDWSRLGQTMSAAVAGEDSVAGREAWIVALTPRGASKPSLRVWIDQKNLMRLRVDRLDNSGQSLQNMALKNISLGDVAPERFQWSPPAGANVTRTSGTLYNDSAVAQRAAGWLQIPSFVPPGYQFESAVIDAAGNGGRGEAWLRYANGVNRFSIFQQRTPETSPIKAQRAGDGWFAQQGGSRFMVLGLPDAQAQKVIASLK
jgi:negative regulator of sigma E activity